MKKNTQTEKSACFQISNYHLPITYYSYASVSRTVNREALRAGKALAIVARTSVKINQAMMPVMP